MHPDILIWGCFQDNKPHTFGMSVCGAAILHHQIHPVVSKEATGFFFVVFSRHGGREVREPYLFNKSAFTRLT